MVQNTCYLCALITASQFKIRTLHLPSTPNGFYPIASIQSLSAIRSLQGKSLNRSFHACTHAIHTHTHAIIANRLFQSTVPFMYHRNSLCLFIIRLANLQSYHIDNYAFTAIQLSLWLRIHVELYAVHRYLLSFTSFTLFETFFPDVLSRFPNAGGRTPSPLKEIQ
jgi:hypothetical protein